MTQAALTESVSDIVGLLQAYRPTPLVECPALAQLADVGRVYLKLEGERPLGNFKVLGGMVAGLRALAEAAGAKTLRALIADDRRDAPLARLVCASEGNHGLSVAVAARLARTRASIFLPMNASRMSAARIEAQGGQIVWVAGTYDDAVREAQMAAARGEGVLISDTTSDPDDPVVRQVMDGYALLTEELVAQFSGGVAACPTHVFAQAGVGGLAAALAQGLTPVMRQPDRLVVVEPEGAACVARALDVGRPTLVEGDLHTCAQMLSCGLASAPAVAVLLHHQARAVLVSEAALRAAVAVLQTCGAIQSTPSGAAGLAGLMHVAAAPSLRAEHALGPESCVLLMVTEGPCAAPA